MEKTIESLYETLIHSTVSKISYALILSILFFIYIKTNDYRILYGIVIGGSVVYCCLMGIIYFHKKGRRNLDIEIAVAITFVDYISRFYTPVIISIINNTIMFIFILLFLIRELKLPIKKNIFFLVGYGLFYFIVSFKFIEIMKPKYSAPIEALVIVTLFTIVLSVVFAYSLLATSLIRNFYRCSYCGAISVLCIIVLGRRMIPTLDDANFLIALLACLIILSIFYIYWYEGKEYYMEISGMRKNTFFHPRILPNVIGVITFLLYIFKVNIGELSVVWGLLIVISLWYLISIISGLKNTSEYPDDAITCDKLNESQLKRLGKYAGYLRGQNFLKKEL